MSLHTRIVPACLALLLAQSPAVRGQEALNAKVDAIFSEYARADSPGCALGVFRDGRIVYAGGYGMANLELGVPIAPSTVFDLGSTSKQFTAACIVLLAQEGKLSLDDDIRKYLPELPDYGRVITVRHLIHHTSGIRDYLALMSLAGVDFDGVTTEEDALALIARQKELNFPPGEEHLYSNSGYFLLGVIVKRASGKSLARFAAERIFEPLGMKHTHFHDDHTRIVPGRATGYARRKEGGFRIAMSGFEQTGDGAVMSTVEDLLQWDRNFYEPKVGGTALIRQLLAPGTLNSGEKLNYAFGLTLGEHRGLKTVSHGGSWAGYRAELLRFPEQNLSVACLCNLAAANPGRLARQVAEVYLGDRMAVPEKAEARGTEAAVKIAETELARRAGLYRHPKSGELRRITLAAGKLSVDAFGPAQELIPLSPTRFRLASQPMELAFEGTGRLSVLRAGAAPEIFEMVPAASPDAAELRAYAGVYYSPELDAKCVLAVEDGKLHVRGRNLPKDPLQPTYRDGFALPGMFLEFTRDPAGAVDGFAVQAGRIRNVRFVRQ